MNNFWDKVFQISLCVAALAVAIIGSVWTYRTVMVPEQNVFGGVFAASAVDLIGTSDTGTAILSTTTAVLSSVGKIDQVNLNIKSFATTSATAGQQVAWRIAYSNDTDCATDAATISWFGEDTNSTSGSVVTHSASTTEHVWLPISAGPEYKQVSITNVNSKCVRFNFAANSTTDDNTIWVQALSKQVTQ